jgi:competence ComEA-like helix-hairpin-helix protein
VKPKQRVLLVVLVLCTLFGQGIRWSVRRDDRTPTLLQQLDGSASAQEWVAPAEHCDLVHINSAGIAELQTLPGIGPVYAERIITARREMPFTGLEDLLRVKGIGPKRLEGLKDLICFYLSEDA